MTELPHPDDTDEWDENDVAQLLGSIYPDDIQRVSRTGLNFHFTFEQNRRTWRYETTMTAGNAWLHVRKDGEWADVWQNDTRY